VSGAPCRVCGRELDDCGTCVCATLPAPRPAPAEWSWEDVALWLGGARSASGRGDDSPQLVQPPCLCECGAQFAFVEGQTESRSCCYFCSQRKRRERLAADRDRARTAEAAPREEATR
jgi:hypothetical protein